MPIVGSLPRNVPLPTLLSHAAAGAAVIPFPPRIPEAINWTQAIANCGTTGFHLLRISRALMSKAFRMLMDVATSLAQAPSTTPGAITP